MFFMAVAILLVVFFYFSRKKIVQKEVEKRDLEISLQKEQLNAVIVTQESERKRIAQDLHDDISSKLNVVALNCHLLTLPDLKPQEHIEIVNTIVQMTTKALENSRKIAHGLLPPVLEKFGLDAGIRELCIEFESSKAVKVCYDNSVVFSLDELDRHLHVFRILQELMNNSLRHGKATEINIKISAEQSGHSCYYYDNGIGFNTKSSKNQKGLGTKNIESRIRFLEGKFQMESEMGQGIQVLFTF